jgi:integrase
MTVSVEEAAATLERERPIPVHSMVRKDARDESSLGQVWGVHPKVVSERLGHASVNITLDTYSHVLPGLQDAAAAALDTVLGEQSAPRHVSNR